MSGVRSNTAGKALLGRRREGQLLSGLLGGAREGHSSVLVVCGEAGIGKTALIDNLVAQVADMRVIRSSGAESEMELVYAGVQQICAPLHGLLVRLPTPQRTALEVALGITGGEAPDRLLVGLALLTLLAEAGAQQPTVCVIDDAHWMDRSSLQALAFAARRLMADRVVVIFATRHSGGALSGLPELALEGLSDADARTLLAALLPGQLSDRMRESIIAEAHGNPLALHELHRALGPAELAGGYGLARAKSVSGRIESTFLRQFQDLPEPTRTLLLIAAAEPTGQPSWLWSAAAHLGITVDAATPAEGAGLIFLDGHVRFRHPLVRSAIYRNAPPSERRRVHDALARTIAASTAMEHRAWHRAHSLIVPDEDIAVELVDAAEQVRARGGIAAAAAFLAEACNATPDPLRKAQRALRAAQAKLDAGSVDAAGGLLALSAELTDDDTVGAHRDLVRAQLAFASSRGRDAPPLMLAAANRLAFIDPLLARDTYLEALMFALIVGRLATDESASATAVAEAARAASVLQRPPTAVDMLLEGLITRLTEGYVAAAPILGAALNEYVREAKAGIADPRWHDITNRVCLDLFDLDAYHFLTKQQLDMQRDAGQLTLISSSLSTWAGWCVTSGRFGEAATALEEVEVLALATDTPPHRSITPYLAAYRGQEKRCLEYAKTTIDGAMLRGEGTEVTVTLYASAVLHNGLAQYPKALSASMSGLEHDDVGMAGYLMAEAVEAATRCGESEIAADTLPRLTDRASASGTDAALGIAARSRALLGGVGAESEYQSAIAHLRRSPVVVYLARTHLVYGEWLRRVNRRADARTELRRAYDMFTQMGADGFASRARRELQATGEAVHQRGSGVTRSLTTQEVQITRLAREGWTNSEIGAQLFISPRTVEWHLGRIFAKLGVVSRRELRSLAIDLP